MGREELLGTLDEEAILVGVSSDGVERGRPGCEEARDLRPEEEQSLGRFPPERISAKGVGGESGGEPWREERGGERAKGARNPEFAFTTTPRPESGAFSLLPAMSLAGNAGRTDARRMWGRGRGCGWGRPAPSLRAGKREPQPSLIPWAAREQLWSSA